MVNYPNVAPYNFPFYCELREHCVLTDIIESTTFSDQLDSNPPDILVPLN